MYLEVCKVYLFDFRIFFVNVAWFCLSLSRQVKYLQNIRFFGFFFFSEWHTLLLTHSETKRPPWPPVKGNDELPTVSCSSRSCKLEAGEYCRQPQKEFLCLKTRRKVLQGNVTVYSKFQKFLLQIILKHYQFKSAILTFSIIDWKSFPSNVSDAKVCCWICCPWILSNDNTPHKLWFMARSPFHAICCHKKIAQSSQSIQKPLCWIFTTWTCGKQGATSINQAVAETIAKQGSNKWVTSAVIRVISKCHKDVPSSLFQILIILGDLFFLAVQYWKLLPVLWKIFHLMNLCGQSKV